MQGFPNALSVLSAMITPAVLVSACGTLIFSTSTRLARIVDRVRELSQMIERMAADETIDFIDARRDEVDRQIATHARRGRIIQRSLTSFYIALGLFVAMTVCLGLVAIIQRGAWIPVTLGIAGTVYLFYGSVLLIAETRLALRSVNSEMEFTLHLRQLYQERRERALK
jgi:threonine/homoserine/homoserine lactone efflux protein